MASAVAARIRAKLGPSAPVVRLGDAILSAGHRLIPGADGRILQHFPMFAPYAAGSNRDRAKLTIQAADRTLPLMLRLAQGEAAAEGPVPIESFAVTTAQKSAADQLKSLFRHYGSDKSSLHNYHFLYGPILAERDSVTGLLEIGLGTNNADVVSNMGAGGSPGASLRAFREFLPRAAIYGADVDRRILFNEDRIETFFVDQTEPSTFDEIGKAIDSDLDLIIDDGLHSPDANLATVLFAIAKVKVGGWLVVEDIAPAALPLWQLIKLIMPEHYDSFVVAAEDALVFAACRTA